MKTTTKTILVTLLLFFITTGVMAQEKYEFAMIYKVGNYLQIITKEGALGVKIDKALNTETELIKKVNEYSANGWEVVSITTPTFNINSTASDQEHNFYLRKKINE
jgi:hypothetical protein